MFDFDGLVLRGICGASLYCAIWCVCVVVCVLSLLFCVCCDWLSWVVV